MKQSEGEIVHGKMPKLGAGIVCVAFETRIMQNTSNDALRKLKHTSLIFTIYCSTYASSQH